MRTLWVIGMLVSIAGCSTAIEPPPTVNGKHRQLINSELATQQIQQKVANRQYAAFNGQGGRDPAYGHARASDQPYIPHLVVVDFAYNSTDFQPTIYQAGMLSQFIASGDRIQVRGRTDASHGYPGDMSIAHGRADAAKVYLVDHGAKAQRITVNYVSGYNHISDNSTSEGRADNRRVEIERMPP